MEMKDEEIIRLIELYLSGGLTDEERQVLEEWRKSSPKNGAFLDSLAQGKSFATEWKLYRSLDTAKAISRFERSVGIRRRSLRRVMRYAAAIVLPIGCALGVYFMLGQRGDVMQPAGYVRPHNAVTLTLASGERVKVNDEPSKSVLLNERVAIRLDSVEGLSYEVRERNGEGVLHYNVLDVPVAAEYRLRLSDGSMVYLNADSRLKYPEAFSGTERKVYLEGEAYFEVAKDAARPFTVVARGVEVEVLGTHFNVNAYPEKNGVVTTLAEGKVRVAEGGHEAVLIPGEQAVASAGALGVREVDVREYISWKDGLFVFRQMPLEQIMEQVYRWYGVKAAFFDESARTETFTGVIDRSMSAEAFFDVIEKVLDVQFKMGEGNQVAITAR